MTIEAENAFALSVVEAKAILPNLVAREKAQAIKKNGLLELVEATESLESIGGLDVLKEWLLKRKHAFGGARQYGLPTPKGLLIVGIPGTGKSLTAKATARVFEVPLLKLDAGRIFAGLVGQSESNLRSVIQTAEAIAPGVLWIDELEKGFAAAEVPVPQTAELHPGCSAHSSPGCRKKSPVFVVATANDVSQLPPEMLRKGRFDELFFVDLPSQAEREAIWAIQMANTRVDPKDFDTVQLAKATEGLTGSEIENAFTEALYLAFDSEKEPTDLDIAQVLTEFVPLSKLMAEQIAGLRNWAKGRARLATSAQEDRRGKEDSGVSLDKGNSLHERVPLFWLLRVARTGRQSGRLELAAGSRRFVRHGGQFGVDEPAEHALEGPARCRAGSVPESTPSSTRTSGCSRPRRTLVEKRRILRFWRRHRGERCWSSWSVPCRPLAPGIG